MAGTKAGGRLAAATNRARYGSDFYAQIGKTGGKNGTTGGFGSTKVGADGLTGPQRAALAGEIGGRVSRRVASKKNKTTKTVSIPVTTKQDDLELAA